MHECGLRLRTLGYQCNSERSSKLALLFWFFGKIEAKFEVLNKLGLGISSKQIVMQRMYFIQEQQVIQKVGPSCQVAHCTFARREFSCSTDCPKWESNLFHGSRWNLFVEQVNSNCDRQKEENNGQQPNKHLVYPFCTCRDSSRRSSYLCHRICKASIKKNLGIPQGRNCSFVFT